MDLSTVIIGIVSMIPYFIFTAYACHKFSKKFNQESERIGKEFDEKWRKVNERRR